MRLTRQTIYAALLAVATTTGAMAQDYAYADSFGNLVILSSTGYKRVLVGRGRDAERVNKFLDRGQPRETDGLVVPRKLYFGYADCYRPGVFVQGRSYMYGLSNGEMPVLSRCR